MTYPKTSPLDAAMDKNDSGQSTVRGYLIELLHTLLAEEEGFSGKRPFGNSGWMSDLEQALVKSGHVNGRLDEDGFVEYVDTKRFSKMMAQCIKELRGNA